ncbi:MAG: hypothetical protein ACRCSB_04865 [Bacteroidales bacterium]
MRRFAKIFLRNQKYLVYGAFLLVATLLWTANKLSNSYSYDVSTIIRLTSSNPLAYMITQGSSTPATLRLYGRGYQLLFYLLFNPKCVNIVVSSSLPHNTLSNLIYLTTTQIYPTVETQLNSSLELQAILPDTLSYVLTARHIKKVPIRSNIKFGYSPQYMPNGSIQVRPDSVFVSGAITDVEGIYEINTQSLTKENVSKKLQGNIALIVPRQTTLSHEKIDYFVDVQRFVEVSFEQEIHARNFPDSLRVQFLPAKVKLSFSVKMEDYKRLKQENFQVVADYTTLTNSLSNQMQVKLDASSKYALSSTIKPMFVDVIVKSSK